MPGKSPKDAIQILDPFSPEGIRETVANVLEGQNYRLFFESVTRRRLIATYQELAKYRMSDEQDDRKWEQAILDKIESGDGADDNLRYWLLGLTHKTAVNLGIKKSGLQHLFRELRKEMEVQSHELGVRDTALLLWAGAATLTVRGSQKAKIGKRLERGIARAILHLVGLAESDGDFRSGDFRLNMQPDQEVDRETDAEIRTPRTTIRMDVAMIGEGNPEVIDDKISRVGRNGIVLFDKLSPKSNAWANGEKVRVKMIQMRNSNPVEAVRTHLQQLDITVADSIPLGEVADRVRGLELDKFNFDD